MFAKLYETELGQILVKVDSEDGGAEVRFFFEPEGLGVCSVAASFKDSSEEVQWEKATAMFEGVTEEIAIEMVKESLGFILSR